MEFNDIPDYSLEGRFVLDAFHLEYTSAFFYFEDAEHESVYERLLQKVFPKIKKFKVICLGGKTQVIEKAREERPLDKTLIFVLDKDYDDLLGSLVVIPGVYYLHKYSIENYFADIPALLHVVVSETPRDATFAKRAEDLGDVAAYLVELKQRLLKVARLFVVARRHRVNILTSKLPLEEMIDGSDDVNPMPTDDWLVAYRQRLKANTVNANDWLTDDIALNHELDNAFNRPDPCNLPHLPEDHHICGKHLMGCLVRLIDNRLGVNLRKLGAVELYIKLTSHLSVQRFSALAEAIKNEHPALFNA